MPRMGDLAATDVYNAFDVPLDQTYDRRLDQTWPGQLVQDAMGAVLAPGRALQSTEPITTEQMIKPAADLAGLVTGGSYAAPAQRGASGAGIRAYHSSPHDFDKFDLAKIGTGEGAQVYGHGLYFAENPAVSGQGGQYWQQFLGRVAPPGSSAREAADRLRAFDFDRAGATEDVRRMLSRTKSEKVREHWSDVLQHLESGQPVGPRTYEVNINADPAHMLDWDKALYQQPEVYDKIRGYAGTVKDMKLQDTYKHFLDAAELKGMPGSDFYQVAKKHGPAALSQDLREAGIPGIKYLDEGSRRGSPIPNARIQYVGGKYHIFDDFGGSIAHADDLATAKAYVAGTAVPNPTSNYVIFDPNIIRIDKKYAVPGAIGAGGMGALAAQDQYRE